MPVKRPQHAAVTGLVVPVSSYYCYIRSYDQGGHAASFEKVPSSNSRSRIGKPDHRKKACVGPAFFAANAPPDRCQPHGWEVAAAWSDGSGEGVCEFSDRDNLGLT
jgi:hypothetical protein